jgi:hypothetical protein
MKKKLLAISVLAAISSQASAFQFDTSDDWQIRWDNTFKANVMARTEKADDQVTFDSTGYFVARDSDWSVDRSGGGLVSTRVDVLSEMDVIWKDNFGFRVSGSAWYDPQYKNGNNDYPSNRNATWNSPSADVGDYNHEVEDMNYAGGELLDAFVFANFDIGDAAIGVRGGRHTIYWGNSLLGTGAVASIGGSMAPLDFAKALSVPGSEAKELFMPTTKISTVIQLTDNLTLNAYYGFEYENYRLPEDGAFFSPAAALNPNSEFLPFIPAAPDVLEVPGRTGYHIRDTESDEGDFGFNLQYYVDAWSLETSFIYINYTDMNLAGLHSGFDFGQFGTILAAGNETVAGIMDLWNATCGGVPGLVEPYDCPNLPRQQGDGSGAGTVVGESRFLRKSDIDLFGISLAKEIAGISVGLDVVYRKNMAPSTELGAGLQRAFNVPDLTFAGLPPPEGIAGLLGLGYIPGDYFSYDSDKYLAPEGDMYTVVLNGIGLLNNQWGLWDGGSWILETTFLWLDECNKNCDLMDVDIHENRVNSHIAGIFRPTWYQMFPGWDMTIPMSVSYTIDGDQAPLAFAGQKTAGSASIGVEFLVNQNWTVNAKYNSFFGGINRGLGALNKDRDNVSMTIKRTF